MTDQPEKLCRSGRHDMTGDNVIYHADGRPHCRECRRETYRAYDRRNRHRRSGNGIRRGRYANGHGRLKESEK